MRLVRVVLLLLDPEFLRLLVRRFFSTPLWYSDSYDSSCVFVLLPDFRFVFCIESLTLLIVYCVLLIWAMYIFHALFTRILRYRNETIRYVG